MKTISGGLYLIIDPARGLDRVLPVVQQAIAGGVDIIQVWNHWYTRQRKIKFINHICEAAYAYGVPVLVHEDWKLLQHSQADGIHFDEAPTNIEQWRQELGRPFLCGITCGNDLQKVQWAIDKGLDYLSFCSMFPSTTANSCELVKPESVQTARRMTRMPIFLAGGITSESIVGLSPTGMDGIAVVSGITDSTDPLLQTLNYKQAIYQAIQKQYDTQSTE
ncbi:thiamine phosphate synthase [Paraflavitalea speifideaquila]|uniref:thiamine phosphate synthase n=1 Tax=Paraflavitalea speifideaquila TaxID=3076558 RepID=UPI0028EDD48E|nr:thiamine phosphate synthase [Paraflavitalea speifideiaquila]